MLHRNVVFRSKGVLQREKNIAKNTAIAVSTSNAKYLLILTNTKRWKSTTIRRCRFRGRCDELHIRMAYKILLGPIWKVWSLRPGWVWLFVAFSHTTFDVQSTRKLPWERQSRIKSIERHRLQHPILAFTYNCHLQCSAYRLKVSWYDHDSSTDANKLIR